jgi:hypothetical protein
LPRLWSGVLCILLQEENFPAVEELKTVDSLLLLAYPTSVLEKGIKFASILLGSSCSISIRAIPNQSRIDAGTLFAVLQSAMSGGVCARNFELWEFFYTIFAHGVPVVGCVDEIELLPGYNTAVISGGYFMLT